MMSLEDRLRDHYEHRTASVPEHGPGLDALDAPLSMAESMSITPVAVASRASRWRFVILGGAAAATIVGLVVVSGLRSGGDQPAPAASAPTATATATGLGQAPLEPTVTLAPSADLADVPVTVVASAPSDWYRLAPDLDVTWYQDQRAGAYSMVCWRTPAGTGCEVDDARPGEAVFVVPTAGGQTLVVVISGETRPDALDVALDDGVVISSPVRWDDTINWGVARYLVPAGATISRVPAVDSIGSDTAPLDTSRESTSRELGQSELIAPGAVVCVDAGATERAVRLCVDELGGAVVRAAKSTDDSFVMSVDAATPWAQADTAALGDALALPVVGFDASYLPPATSTDPTDSAVTTYLVLGRSDAPYTR